MEAWPISSGLQNWTGHRRTHCRPGEELALAGRKTMGVTLSHKKLMRVLPVVSGNTGSF